MIGLTWLWLTFTFKEVIMGDKSFYNELNKLYGAEDFTGHLGVLLGDDSSFENEYQKKQAKKSAKEFLKHIYSIATKCI